MSNGNVVFDVESVTRNLPMGMGTIELLRIYEARNGLIHKASFAVGSKALLTSTASWRRLPQSERVRRGGTWPL